MSNNDLYCHKCKSHHHPVCCPLDMSKDDWLVEILMDSKYWCPSKKEQYRRQAHSIRQELVRILEGKKKYYKQTTAFGHKNISERMVADKIRNSTLDEVIKEIGNES